MPNIKSAIKRVNVTERNYLRNNAIKSSIKTAIRKFKDQLAKNKEDASVKELLDRCCSKIDRAVTKGVYHKNTAARKKSRLMAFYHKALEASK